MHPCADAEGTVPVLIQLSGADVEDFVYLLPISLWVKCRLRRLSDRVRPVQMGISSLTPVFSWCVAVAKQSYPKVIVGVMRRGRSTCRGDMRPSVGLAKERRDEMTAERFLRFATHETSKTGPMLAKTAPRCANQRESRWSMAA